MSLVDMVMVGAERRGHWVPLRAKEATIVSAPCLLLWTVISSKAGAIFRSCTECSI